jgi:hypothetical protein
MKRRHFLASLGTLPAGSVLVAAQPPPTVRRLATDVLVIGGGSAGAIAAIQAGRLGAKTMLVEAGSQLGGTTTTGGVDFPGLFHAWGKQVIAGIGWELVKKTVELNNDALPDFTVPTGRQHWRHQVRISGQLYAALAEEACVQAGVQLRYCESPLTVEEVAGGWRVRLVGKGTMVDVTGEAARGLHRQRVGGRAGGLRADAGGNAPARHAGLPYRRLRCGDDRSRRAEGAAGKARGRSEVRRA